MLESLEELRADGQAYASDIDVEVLARAIHCLHVGYFLTRRVFAPDRQWDDAGEIEQMADILANGASSKTGNKSGKSSKPLNPRAAVSGAICSKRERPQRPSKAFFGLR